MAIVEASKILGTREFRNVVTFAAVLSSKYVAASLLLLPSF